ncbi:MAG: ABC transporter ATP-binding protein [Gammaproteobacteria bacterium]|nr:ABC transporter ATP-binding protein [Gammaproteobacteria bacterium]
MLEMRGITKRFPGVVANDNVSFNVRAGEVHTLLGENGAGKSTLMKILYGLYRPDEGQVLLNGVPVNLKSPADAIAHRIGMIHQHFMLVPTLTVTENVALGLNTRRGPLTDLGSVATRIRELSDRYGLQVDPDARIWQLAVGERQRVEIIKALYRNVQLLILDEPTAVLTPQEVDDFFQILREMKNDGRGLIFISHKLHEVMELSDRITVLRNGKLVGATTPTRSSREDLARMMVGRDVGSSAVSRPASTRNQTALEVRGLRVAGDRGVDALVDVNLSLKAGEILGIAGVSGNGQRELAESITGLRRVSAGSVLVDGQDITGRTPNQVRQAGIAFVPEERMRDGAIGEFTVADNMVLLNHTTPTFSRGGFLRFNAIRKHCRKLVSDYQVKTPDIDTPTRNLSGGNIQKLIMARELTANPEVLIAAQPTRGVDIGAAEYIHERLLEQRNSGTAIMVISEDLDEVMALSDRIAVICEGRIMGIVDRAGASREQIGLMMAGVTDSVA